MANIFILCAGTWGLALANTLNKHQITVWSPFPNEISMLKESLSHKNLPGVVFSSSIDFSTSLSNLSNADYVILATPSLHIRSTLHKVKDFIPSTSIIINASKGIENESLMFLSSVINNEVPNNPIVVLSGPTHAEEVAINMPTTIICASYNQECAKSVADLFEDTCIRAYTNSDVTGVELSGALKNVIALTCGISKGLGYGDNMQAAIMTRGMNEIARLGKAMGCFEQTFSGLSGIGNLIVTATSVNSRNNRCG